MPTQWSEAEQVPLGCIAPPRPQAWNPPASLCEGGVKTEGFDGGRDKKETGGVEPRPYARLSMAHTFYVRADVGIRPYARLSVVFP